MKAGKGAGVKTCVLVRTGKAVSEESEKSADILINSVADLPALIKKLKK